MEWNFTGDKVKLFAFLSQTDSCGIRGGKSPLWDPGKIQKLGFCGNVSKFRWIFRVLVSKEGTNWGFFCVSLEFLDGLIDF